MFNSVIISRQDMESCESQADYGLLLEKKGIPTVVDSFGATLSDPNIDFIFNAEDDGIHITWLKR